MLAGEMLTVAITGGVGGGAVYLMRRIAAKIETRLDQVEDHEKRLAVVERVCSIRHNDEHSRAMRSAGELAP